MDAFDRALAKLEDAVVAAERCERAMTRLRDTIRREHYKTTLVLFAFPVIVVGGVLVGIWALS